MRALPVAILLLATAWVSPHATAACSGWDRTVGNGPNTVWVSDWRCDGEDGDPEVRSETVRVDTFSPFGAYNQEMLASATSTSKVDRGEFGSYKRTDTIVLLAGGRLTSVTMTTSEDTAGRTTCTLSVTAAGIAAATGAPMPACIPGDSVLL